jgi:hypothetical protein
MAGHDLDAGALPPRVAWSDSASHEAPEDLVKDVVLSLEDAVKGGKVIQPREDVVEHGVIQRREDAVERTGNFVEGGKVGISIVWAAALFLAMLFPRVVKTIGLYAGVGISACAKHHGNLLGEQYRRMRTGARMQPRELQELPHLRSFAVRKWMNARQLSICDGFLFCARGWGSRSRAAAERSGC